MVEKLMSMLERLDFGRLGAEADTLQDDPELFVTTRQSKAFHFPQHRIILGRKGSGKTALAQNFSGNYTSTYDFLLPIDADAIRFRKIIEDYRTIECKAGGTIELKKAMTNIWEHAILTSCMILVADRVNTFSGVGATIHNFLRKQGLLKKRIYDLLVDTIDGMLQVCGGQQGKAVSEIIKAIDNYPLNNTDFQDACQALREYLSTSKGILVTFDRIDTYFEVEARPYETDQVERYALRNAIAGLVQAVYNISVSSLGKKIEFKVFLPEDKYEAVRSRDLDKIKEFIFKIEWTPTELKELIARRIAHSLDIRDRQGTLQTDLANTWYRIFPRTVTNKQVGQIPEDIADYLIRHTHYKPRDLQYYCAKARALSLAEDDVRPTMSEDIVRKAVRDVSKELVDNLFIEFAYEYPFLKRLIEQFRRSPNLLSFTEQFYPYVSRFRSREKLETSPDELINLLFKVGFVGAVISKRNGLEDDAPTRKVKGRVFSFYFSYIDPGYDIRHCEMVAIHPIFNEYLYLETDPNLIVG
jgi:hypothetical protein